MFFKMHSLYKQESHIVHSGEITLICRMIQTHAMIQSSAVLFKCHQIRNLGGVRYVLICNLYKDSYDKYHSIWVSQEFDKGHNIQHPCHWTWIHNLEIFQLAKFVLERNIEEWISFCSTKAMYKMTPLPIFSHLILLIHTGFHISLSEGNDSFAKILISRKIYSSEESNLLRCFFAWICKHEDLFFWFIKSLLSEKYYSSWRLWQAN